MSEDTHTLESLLVSNGRKISLQRLARNTSRQYHIYNLTSSFNRLLVCLLVLHYISDLVFHAAQLIQTVDKEERFTKGTTKFTNPTAPIFHSPLSATRYISNTFLVLSRLGSIILAVLTLWYGLALDEERVLNYQAGYYNIAPIRLAILGGILVLQVYVLGF